MKPTKQIAEHGFSPEDDDLDIVLALMDEVLSKNQRKRWYVEGKCMGWDRRNGFMWAEAENAITLLQKMLSVHDAAIRVYHYGRKGLAINCFHHDSPSGDEWYYITTTKPAPPKPVLRSKQIDRMLRKQVKASDRPFIF